jgi:hypothetical protein
MIQNTKQLSITSYGYSTSYAKPCNDMARFRMTCFYAYQRDTTRNSEDHTIFAMHLQDEGPHAYSSLVRTMYIKDIIRRHNAKA